jgi:hypothetical protein
MTAQDWQVGRLVECCLKQKGDYYPHLAQEPSFLKSELSFFRGISGSGAPGNKEQSAIRFTCLATASVYTDNFETSSIAPLHFRCKPYKYRFFYGILRFYRLELGQLLSTY